MRDFQERLTDPAWRLGLLTARMVGDRPALVAVLLDLVNARTEIVQAVPPGGRYPSLTPQLPQAHWFERAVHDCFGVVPEGHPRFKDLVLHEAWPADWFPLRDGPPGTGPRRAYSFLEVKGDGVYEIPVGPIHAGIIEPGHFRFSCVGEVVQNLEIRLGYQHRGVERGLCDVPWRHARHLVEAASSDTAVGNALAHALALESLCGVSAPRAAVVLRALALEIERVACHLGDVGGICADIGYSGGASLFSRMRGQALGVGERLTGSRLQTAYVRPGGVTSAPNGAAKASMSEQVATLARDAARAIPLLLDNPSALDRMEGTGRVRPRLAHDFGLVGPAGRASAGDYDVRVAFRQAPYVDLGLSAARRSGGDVLARVQVRAQEIEDSLGLVDALLAIPLDGPHLVELPDRLPADGAAVGIVEAWRGELIHLVFTDADGRISRYALKDPSFNNWTGLAIAARGELVSDFPLCNKSFSLSYSGNDL